MISQEFMQASHQERMREAAAVLREAQALATVERKAASRRSAFPRLRGLPLPSFISGRSRVAPAP